MLVVSIDLISQWAYYYPCKAEQDTSIIVLLRMSKWKLYATIMTFLLQLYDILSYPRLYIT